VVIVIEKRLPVQGGLGAGSANAAAALLGLNAELRRLGAARELSKEECLRLAAETGSDVPLFLVGGAVLGTGRGEQVAALEDFRSYPVVVAAPDAAVSTPEAFREWDARAALTGQGALDRLEVSSQAVARVWARAGSSGANPAGGGLAEDPFLALVRTGITNDFETVVLPQHPLLHDLKHALAGTPTQNLAGSADGSAIWAALSGSGSSLFGVYQTAEAARAAAKRVEQLGAKALVTRTLGRDEYWREMWLAGE
jgi:4-diphosphocytidyl-2-C-methyl-D-erythritol kinase